MLNNLIKELEAKIAEYDVLTDVIKNGSYEKERFGLKQAISIIKQHESEFEDAIIKAWDYGLHKGYTGDIGTAQDYYNQNYKNE